MIDELVEYTKIQDLYTTPNNEDGDVYQFDFSSAKYEKKETNKIISKMVQEIEVEKKTKNV